tara:strand:- start:308 stop:1084 length:777 start_codon:yes stop_codon:yes gene_type:complete
MKKHISFSELKIWNECPYKHKLVYIDKVKNFLGNEYTAFGTAIHHVCEKAVIDEKTNLLETFNYKFLEEIKLLTEKNVEIKKDLIRNMRKQGEELLSHILPALKETFPKFEVFSVEEMLYEPIEENDVKFKGYIDLVLKTPNGKYHVIDWKTCSWGWDSRKKVDRMITYQLTLYKHFFARKHNIDFNDINTHFALLKRTAKNNKVEIYQVPNGKIKTKNALNLLYGSLYNVKNNKFIKNKLSCTQGYGCEFYKTEHCK